MFKIEITETSMQKMSMGQQWELTGEKKDGKPEYGYTPAIVKEVSVERTVLTQEVEELNIEAVIKAVNDIK